MLGSVHLLQTLEYIYYAKRVGFSGLIYFDTFPSREDPVAECAQNIRMYKALSDFIDRLSIPEIEQMIQSRRPESTGYVTENDRRIIKTTRNLPRIRDQSVSDTGGKYV